MNTHNTHSHARTLNWIAYICFNWNQPVRWSIASRPHSVCAAAAAKIVSQHVPLHTQPTMKSSLWLVSTSTTYSDTIHSMEYVFLLQISPRNVMKTWINSLFFVCGEFEFDHNRIEIFISINFLWIGLTLHSFGRPIVSHNTSSTENW